MSSETRQGILENAGDNPAKQGAGSGHPRFEAASPSDERVGAVFVEQDLAQVVPDRQSTFEHAICHSARRLERENLLVSRHATSGDHANASGSIG